MLGAPIYYSAPPRLPPNLTPCHLGTLVPVVTNRDPRVGSGVAILNIPGHGEIELTRHGSRQPCISGAPKSSVGSNSRRGHPGSRAHPGSRQSDSAAGKRKPPRRAAGEVAALLGGRDGPRCTSTSQQSVGSARQRKRTAPVPSSEFGSALWLGARQPATHRVLGRIMNPRRCPAMP